ncbi:MAG: TrmB family transcriptional regulator [bacterium]|nr:TrmB family transcriptional regulator [bacterium]
MDKDLSQMDFERLWRKLQQMGLNGYEARTYLVLVGHPRFKALELANRSSVPRQKIYEVLDSLVEKGFAEVVQEKTKLFSAVDPALAIPNYLNRRHETMERAYADKVRMASGLVEDLNAAYSEAQEGRGTLDFLRIVSDPGQAAVRFRQMLGDVHQEYVEFARPPFAAEPIEAELVRGARARGVRCRVLVEPEFIRKHRDEVGADYLEAGVEIRQCPSLPMKLAVFDARQGMIALLDPVITKPAWTTVVFEHEGMGQAMQGLFEDYWRRSAGVDAE